MRLAAVICGVLLSSVLLGPAALSAQQFPGRSARDLRDRNSRLAVEYRQGILADVSRVMLAWRDAWEADDARSLSRLYSDDGVVIRPTHGAAYRGRDEIEGFFTEILPNVRAISTDVLDLDAADRMAYLVTRYTSSPSQGIGGAGTMQGTLISVFQLQGRDWRIRSQTFLDEG